MWINASLKKRHMTMKMKTIKKTYDNEDEDHNSHGK